jgi:type II secretion system protein J
MELDVAQAMHRPVRGANGLLQPAWAGLPVPDETGALLAFTRAGVPDQSQAMLAPQRIGYGLRQDAIVLLHWPYPDQAPNTNPLIYPLLTGVRSLELKYMDTSGNWLTQWPPSPTQSDNLPFAVEADVTLDSGEKITRVFAL